MACTLQCWMALGPKCRCVCNGQFHGIFNPESKAKQQLTEEITTRQQAWSELSKEYYPEEDVDEDMERRMIDAL